MDPRQGDACAEFFSDQHIETPIDVFVRPPFSFDEEFTNALREDVEPGIAVRLVTLPTPLRLKAEAAGPMIDIEHLRLREEEMSSYAREAEERHQRRKLTKGQSS